MSAIYVGTLLGAMLAGAVLTGLVRRYALARAVLDVPNERSLHTIPTPRGGGLAIAVTVSAVHAACLGAGWLPLAGGSAWGLAAALLAALGWMDDHRPLPARSRFLVQLGLGWAALAAMGPGVAAPGAAAVLAGGILLTWFVNLYNFMDGADGLAAAQGIVAGATLGLCAALDGDAGTAVAALALAGASGGFLVWNRPPARIFLGDVGSYFLGGYLGLLGAATLARGGAPWPWLIVLASFVTDATLTLCRRMLRGERWWTAHRTHAYQRLVTSGWSHARLARAFLALSLGLSALAVAARAWPASAPWLALCAYGSTVTIWAMVLRRNPDRPTT